MILHIFVGQALPWVLRLQSGPPGGYILGTEGHMTNEMSGKDSSRNVGINTLEKNKAEKGHWPGWGVD